MAAHMDRQLRAAEHSRRALAFVVIVPNWRPEKAAAALSGSRFLRRTLTAANRQHSYYEGAQHRRPPNKLRGRESDPTLTPTPTPSPSPNHSPSPNNSLYPRRTPAAPRPYRRTPTAATDASERAE